MPSTLGRQKWEVFGVEVCRCNWLFTSLVGAAELGVVPGDDALGLDTDHDALRERDLDAGFAQRVVHRRVQPVVSVKSE